MAAGTMATDFFVGAVFIANRGTAPCTLRGNPEVALLANDASPLDVRLASVTGGAPQGIGASAPLQWSNYCDDVVPASFRLRLPEAGGVVDGTFIDLAGKPLANFGTPP